MIRVAARTDRPPFEIAHQVAGRVRFKVPALIESNDLTSSLCGALAHEVGVVDVRANARCASLVVTFNSTRMDVDRLSERLLRLLSGEPQAVAEPSQSIKARWLGRITAMAAGAKRRVQRLAQRRPAFAAKRAFHRQPAPPVGKARHQEQQGLFCRLYLRLLRWMMRTTFRCWWRAFLSGDGARRKRLPETPVPAA